MRTRIISREDCPVCKDYINRLKNSNIKYEIYDADLDENQDELDKWKIKDLPVVQILKEDGEVRHQFQPGGVSSRTINYFISKLENTNDI